ncbi:MAG: DUF937 domain-containing protein [Gammaproteobacteria bacterium]|nr:DUF937 domain-containing protein [Gammaproteobacteria bacterium]
MNILQELLKSQNGQVVGQLASQFGLDTKDASKALSNLIPAIAGGIRKTAKSPSGLESLIAKVEANQELRRAVDRPKVLAQPQATEAGNQILGDIFGSKEVSRTVAAQTAKSTGLDLGVLKKMLPLIAGLVMSSLDKQGKSTGGGLGDLLGGQTGQRVETKKQSGLGGLLGGLFGKKSRQSQASGGLESMLDFDGDGDIADDVLDLARKLF